MSLIMWMTIHRFITIIIGLILAGGTFATIRIKWFSDYSYFRWILGALTLIFWCGAIFFTVHPVNMSSFTHLQEIGTYQKVSPDTIKGAKTITLKDATGKQFNLDNADQYSVRTQTQGLAGNQVSVQQRGLNSNATPLQTKYFNLFKERGLKADSNGASRGQIMISKDAK